MLITTINLYDFRCAFADYDRASQFSYEGLDALYRWLDELAEDTGTPYELDVIALCCEFSEYSDLTEIQETYSLTDIDSIEMLSFHTIVIEFNGGLIIQNF